MPSEILRSIRRELAPGERENRLLPLIEDGRASVSVLGELAAQQHRIITSDRRSLLVLAARCADTPAGGYFAHLAQGESLALDALSGFGTACGLDSDDLRAREPLPGCQAYPAYLAWLALNGEPTAVVLALAANFSAWGGYCATVSRALRTHYGFGADACAFFDFFAAPAPELEDETDAVLSSAGPTTGTVSAAHSYGRLLQAYELMFWNTLADLPNVR
ncbi:MULTISPECIES: transcriptional regulator [unclassified Kitasatospora]|uniref:transcriptional regulator n=1 Tax=unclassified Kitasatospora TaxID=2633591 RepID=UPI002475954D|nr:transcriptional regulator [Kitasatospora sp. MAP12-44]